MTPEQELPLDARTQAGLRELQTLIQQQYPEATFRVRRGQDAPGAIHLVTTVDVEDTTTVLDAVVDRMMALQIDQGLPIFVIPVRPVERALALRRQLAQAAAHRGSHSPPQGV